MGLPNFHHHPDDLVYIRTESGYYLDTPENFALDMSGVYSGVPSGYIERYYEPGVSHQLRTSYSADPQNLSWAEGDAYISGYSTIVSNKEARISGASGA